MAVHRFTVRKQSHDSTSCRKQCRRMQGAPGANSG
jgi:hypothetical protein